MSIRWWGADGPTGAARVPVFVSLKPPILITSPG
jgi:hypothetical protein